MSLHRALLLGLLGCCAVGGFFASKNLHPLTEDRSTWARPAQTQAYIVQGPDFAALKQAVHDVDGDVTHDLHIIQAVGARLTTSQLEILTRHEAVARIHEDQIVYSSTASLTVRDNFDNLSYSGSDGSSSWGIDWQEIDPGDGGGYGYGSDSDSEDSDSSSSTGGPANGQVRIVNGKLRLDDAPNSGDKPRIWRKVDLSGGYDQAVLSFDFSTTSGVDSSDVAVVEVSAGNGAPYVILEQFKGIYGASSGSRTYDISPFISNNTKIRFKIKTLYGGYNEYFFVDNVEIRATGSGGANADPPADDPDDDPPNDEPPPAADPDSNDGGSSSSVPFSDFPSLVGVDLLHQQGYTGEGITVAVLDTGLYIGDDLRYDSDGDSRLIAGYDAINNRVEIGNDANGHGTHVASIIFSSEQPTDRPGVYNGVAPDANIVSVKAFGTLGTGSYLDIIRGLQWLVDNRGAYNIRVLNLSFSALPRSYYWDDPLNQAVMRAWSSGIAVVSSAGNTGPEPMTIGVPGNVPYVITVGGMTDSFTPDDPRDDKLSRYSAAGPTAEGFVKPDMIAPGGHIRGFLNALSHLASQHPEWFDGAYFTMSGTSQAAAVVSGIAALLLEANPWLTPDELKCRLMATANPAVNADGSLAYSPLQQGAGLVQAYDASLSNELTCANRGLSVIADIYDIVHFAGPVRWSNDKGFYVEETGYFWDGTYVARPVLNWTNASPLINATPWVDGSPFVNATPWVDNSPLINATPWVDAYVFDETTPEPSLSTTTSINLWVGQD